MNFWLYFVPLSYWGKGVMEQLAVQSAASQDQPLALPHHFVLQQIFLLGFLKGSMIIIYSSKFSPSVLILLLILLLITELGVWGSKNNSYYFCLCSFFSPLSCFFSVKWFFFPWPVSLLSSTNLPFHHVCWTTRKFPELCAYPWSYSWYGQSNNFFKDCSYPNDQVKLMSSDYIWIENTWKTIFSKKQSH